MASGQHQAHTSSVESCSFKAMHLELAPKKGGDVTDFRDIFEWLWSHLKAYELHY